jgi:hypothetical protein
VIKGADHGFAGEKMKEAGANILRYLQQIGVIH